MKYMNQGLSNAWIVVAFSQASLTMAHVPHVARTIWNIWMTTTKLCDIAYVGGKNEGAGNIVSEFHCLTHGVYWVSESMYAPLLCYRAREKTPHKKNVRHKA